MMIKQRIAHSFTAFALLAASFAAQADVLSVANAAQLPVGSTVEIQGQLVAQHGPSFFGFSDGSGEIEVHVTDAAWNQIDDLVGPEDKLLLHGPLQSDADHPLYVEVVKMQMQP